LPLSEEIEIHVKEIGHSDLSKTIQTGLAAGKWLEMLDLLIREAVLRKVSDIHLLSEENGIRVLIRKDGQLYPLPDFPKDCGEQLFTRLKILGRMISYQKRVPQDGHISPDSYTDDPTVDIRIAIAPVVTGEQAVIRILHGAGDLLPLESLGWSGKTLEKYIQILHRRRGVILLTGPCGSGKTTTIAASLKALLAGDSLHICTVEDPVEYRIPGVSHMAVDKTAGLGFAQGVRAWLRHDPDVLAVGEIRDPETAAVVMEAGLLGHLVFSTVHGGSVAAVIIRLLDMGISPGTLIASLTAVISQRLVRVLCPSCRRETTDWPTEVDALSRPEAVQKIYLPQGCAECGMTGYRGRKGLVDLVPLNDATCQAILSRQPIGELKKTLAGAAISTLWGHGWELVGQGITSPMELLRVIGE